MVHKKHWIFFWYRTNDGGGRFRLEKFTINKGMGEWYLIIRFGLMGLNIYRQYGRGA